MSLLLVLLVCVMSVIEPRVAVGIAPGDEEPLCQQLRAQGAAPIPNYTPNMRVLMDSWNYQNLLPARIGAIWEQVDNDSNNPTGTITNVSINSQQKAIIFIMAT